MLAEKQVERWIVVWFDRGKRHAKRAASPRHCLHNLAILIYALKDIPNCNYLTEFLRLVILKARNKLSTIKQLAMALRSIAQSISRHVMFDTDSAIFVMDNGDTAHTCNLKTHSRT